MLKRRDSIALVLAVTSCIAADAYAVTRETPAQTVTIFYSGSPRARCERSTIGLRISLRNRLAPAARRLSPFDGCVRYMRREPGIRPGEVVAGAVKIRGQKATVEVTTPPPNGPEIAHLVRRNGAWKVDFIGAGQE